MKYLSLAKKRENMIKLILFSGVVVAIIFFIIFFQAGAETSKPSSFSYSNYISAFTSGIIPRSSSIKVRFTSELVDDSKIGTKVDEGVFVFNPQIKGKAYWTDKRTLEFLPEELLPSGKRYEGALKLDYLYKGTLPDSLKIFWFEFGTIFQNFDVVIDRIEPEIEKDIFSYILSGRIVFADLVDSSIINSIISSDYLGKKLQTTVTYNAGSREHSFFIKNIERKDSPSLLTIKFNGKSLGIDKKGEETLTIPGLNEFKVIRLQVIQGKDSYISIEFSDILSSDNDLDGLVMLDNIYGIRTIVASNELRIYPPAETSGKTLLRLFPGIRNINGVSFDNVFEQEIMFEDTKPAVRFVKEGTILPSTNGWMLPFDAVNLDRVDVKIIKIFESNIPVFLQNNELYTDYNLQQVGRPILKKTITLGDRTGKSLNKWNRYSIDLSKIINTEPGAIYQIGISFKKAYSVYECGENIENNKDGDIDEVNEKYDDYNASFWDYYDYYYYFDEDYDWEQRDNPCDISYYTAERFITKNIFASDLGLIAKIGSNGDFLAAVTDIITAEPMENVSLNVYDYQLQLIASGKTGRAGKYKTRLTRKPFLLTAEYKQQKGYLKLLDGNALSISNFDVEGANVSSGMKGFIYGERGVWRPGDSLYLTFVLEDKVKSLPDNHPAVFELFNPRQQVYKRIVKNESIDGVYDFRTCTDPDALTGNWLAKIKIGGAEFSKTIKIETVKPNRLKINLDFGTDKITPANNNLKSEFSARWLHGAPAGPLKADISYILTKGKTDFKAYKDYNFEDPTVSIQSQSVELFKGNLNDDGKKIIQLKLDSKRSPGTLAVHFDAKVFEPGGAFSFDRFSIPYYPYDSYVGIKIPKGDRTRGALVTDKSHRIEFALVDYNGNKLSRKQILISVYKLNWRWWWDKSEDYQLNYINSRYSDRIIEDTIAINGGKGSWEFKIDYHNWGRYLVTASDPVSGHSTGSLVYVDWPDWAGGDNKQFPGAATMLAIETDKEKYKTGETVKVKIPSSKNGKALISIENGTTQLETFWIDTKQGETTFSFEAKPEMSPNIYLHVTLLQPHGQTINDLPMRLYGIAPISVDNPSTHLSPKILMSDQLAPEHNVSIRVMEEKGREMTYTLALVDEGLLDLTRFKTPDPYNHFYALERLGVNTWDIYDNVIGAYGGQLDKMLAVGGDAAGVIKRPAKANRFKPMVKFLGPFSLKAGKTDVHTFKMPNYVGAVRTMVVATKDGAYGSTEKTVPVKKALMLIGTLPRTLTPGDEIDLPVTVFAMENKIKNVSIRLNASNNIQILGGSQQNIVFSKTGEKTIYFRIKVKEDLGLANIAINASSGNEMANYKFEVDIRNPNHTVTDVISALIEPGKRFNIDYKAIGMKATNKATLELSSIPPLNLGKRLNFLIQYPYGCLEQTVSAAFPQLYLSKMMKLDKKRSEQIDRNIKATINSIHAHQTPNGGFAFWQGNNEVNDWATSYAGHFLIKAKEKGYFVSEIMLRKWKDYQVSEATRWTINSTSSDLAQAYRLYTLALNNTAQTGAMNRMRETPKISTMAKWRLAAAYSIASYPEAAENIVKGISTNVNSNNDKYTFGSELRDKAMILEAVSLLGKRKLGVDLMNSISKALSNDMWLNTQTTAFCLISAAEFTGDANAEFSFSYKFKGETLQNIKSGEPMVQINAPISLDKGNSVEIKNTGKGIIYARLVLEGIPSKNNQKYVENNLKMNINYLGIDGKKLNAEDIAQGTDFLAVVTVSNPSTSETYDNLALAQLFPSGWEILADQQATKPEFKSSRYDYRNVRDDRVYTYFNIRPGETKQFITALNACYSGIYYLPAVLCEDMYNAEINSRIPGKTVNVRKLKEN